jgi:hypothetical protein
MDPKYASVEECEKVWGARFSNSHGFKYKKQCTNLKVFCRVEELCPKVYQKGVITNNEINLSFAKGISIEQKGLKVCWVAFVAKVQYPLSQTCKIGQSSMCKKRTRLYMERKAKSKYTRSEHTNGKGIVGSSNVAGDLVSKRKKIIEVETNKHQLQANGSNVDLTMEEVHINQTSNDITTLHYT